MEGEREEDNMYRGEGEGKTKGEAKISWKMKMKIQNIWNEEMSHG